MKKMFILLTTVIISSIVLSGCMNTRIQSPEGKVVKLGHKSGNVNGTFENRSYYLAWGLAPITDVSSDSILDSTIFKDESVIVAETQITFIDYLIQVAGNVVFPTTIRSKTLEIEKMKK